MGGGGAHGLPPLATFSLQGRVGVVTGGARGLGLVMGQGMVVSGADLASGQPGLAPSPSLLPILKSSAALAAEPADTLSPKFISLEKSADGVLLASAAKLG